MAQKTLKLRIVIDVDSKGMGCIIRPACKESIVFTEMLIRAMEVEGWRTLPMVLTEDERSE